jgi:hypothetical protein
LIEAPKQPDLLAFHFAPHFRPQVIVAEQMQHTMDHVPHHLRLPGGLKFGGLCHRVVHADEDFAVEPSFYGRGRGVCCQMVEGDDIR